MKVLLDANALMAPGRNRISLFDAVADLVGAFEPLVLRDVLTELEGIARGAGIAASQARAALQFASLCRPVEQEGIYPSVDDRLLAYAKGNDCMVLTNDRDLRDALLAGGIPVISVRQRRILQLFRP